MTCLGASGNWIMERLWLRNGGAVVSDVAIEGEISAKSLTLEEAIANLRSDDPSLRYYAAWWVGRFRVSQPDVIAALIESLAYEVDRTEAGAFPLQRNAARALGKLADRSAVPALIRSLDSTDYYVREAAAQALGMLGDDRAVPGLVALLDGGVAAAVAVPGQPHLVQPYDAVLEALGNLAATGAIGLVESFTRHEMPKVQYAAVRAMYQLTGDAAWGDRLVTALRGPDLQLRRAVMGDVGAIGYLAGAEAIAQTQAENSLKLIALKGLAEHPNATPDGQTLTAASRQILALMDSLL